LYLLGPLGAGSLQCLAQAFLLLGNAFLGALVLLLGLLDLAQRLDLGQGRLLLALLLVGSSLLATLSHLPHLLPADLLTAGSSRHGTGIARSGLRRSRLNLGERSAASGLGALSHVFSPLLPVGGLDED